jgi:heme/copper-type cytochrome/quinol oxidase subunit 2
LLSIPYVSFGFIVINAIITFVLIIYAFIALSALRKKENNPDSPASKQAQGSLIGIIVVVIISLALLLSFGIYSIIKYKPRQDLEIASIFVPEAGAALTAYDAAKGK